MRKITTETIRLPAELHLRITRLADLYELEGPDQVATLALSAFATMAEDATTLSLPLMLSQVPGPN